MSHADRLEDYTMSHADRLEDYTMSHADRLEDYVLSLSRHSPYASALRFPPGSELPSGL